MKDAEEINKKFRAQIKLLADKEKNSLKKANLGISICKKTLSKLRKQIENNELKSITTEVYFFKNIKPVPMSYLIYFLEIKTYEQQKPKAGIQYQINFLEKKLKKINKFFYRNSDFVSYMELGHTYLDHQFFSRKNTSELSINPLTHHLQTSEFSTTHDVLWSKIKAMNKLIDFIKNARENLHFKDYNKITPSKNKNTLVWTAPKSALIELIYALYSVKSLNYGKADLRTIQNNFEEVFNIKLNQIYKTYAEMKARRGSQTKFIDELSVYLKHKMRREDLN